MAKLGRPFRYQSDEERPETISLRLPRDLHERLKRYAYEHRLSITVLVKEGLEWRLGEGDPLQNVSFSDILYYDNTVIQKTAEPEDPAPDTRPAEAPPVIEKPTSATSVVQYPQEAEGEADAVPSFNTSTQYLGKLCPRGHDYQGTGQSLRRRTSKKCLDCDAEEARVRRQARKARTAEGKR